MLATAQKICEWRKHKQIVYKKYRKARSARRALLAFCMRCFRWSEHGESTEFEMEERDGE